MKSLSIDIETFSSEDLTRSGVYRYAEAPDFRVLLFGYSCDGGPVSVVDLASGETLPPAVLSALLNDTVIKWAFNASFEFAGPGAAAGRPVPAAVVLALLHGLV